MPDWLIFVLIFVGVVVIFAVIKALLSKKDDVPSPSADHTRQSTSAISSRYSSTSASEDYLEDDEEEEDPEDMTDKWLAENDVDDDTYGSLLTQYFSLEDAFPVKNITIDHDNEEEELTFSFVFPKTDVEKEIDLTKDNVEFYVQDLEDGVAKVKLVFDEDIWDDTPDYDSETELPIDQMDWDYVVEDIYNIEVYLTQEQYDKLFPTVSLFSSESE